MTVRASVLIPTHDQPTTLPVTVDTVLHQTVDDLEVLLIGDGVSPAARRAIDRLVAVDERVRFLDFPKGPHHGERYRHDAVDAARSDAIFYLCDDDLLLPDHVADLLALLTEHTLVQSLNGHLDTQGRVHLYAADLSDPETIALHLRDDVRFNAVSITGTAHSKAFYLEVGEHWDTTPAGAWPDHHQWRRLMRHASFRGATSSRMTALQFPTSADDRHTWNPAERHSEIEPWHRLVRAPGGQDHVDELVRRGAVAQLAEERRAVVLVAHDRELAWQGIEAAHAALAELELARGEAHRLSEVQLASARDAHARLAAALDVAEGYRVGLVAWRENAERLRERLRRARGRE
ncbi:MAG: glycosyltransferase [Nocardioides sp.]